MTELSGRLESKVSKLKIGRRREVDFASVEAVKWGYLAGGGQLPRLVQPVGPDIDLAGWAASQRETIERELVTSGAILFRGFGLVSVAEFEALAQAICPSLYGEYGDLPREEEGRQVYRSTPYPADKAILFHNESSHMDRFPLKQWFFCVQTAAEGGETPLVDCRQILNRLDPMVVEEFERKGLFYLRLFTDGLDVSWRDFFRTEDRDEVESKCRAAGLDFAWTPRGLRTRQWARAVVTHPQTGEKSFFNQIQLHHPACLEPEVRSSLQEVFGPEDLPRNVIFGDGTAIPDDLVREIEQLYWRQAVAFPWMNGDVLMVDNVLTAHARNPFTGARKIVVAMGDIREAGGGLG